MTETDLSDWLPIADAARAAGCSTRTIERLGRAGKIEKRLRPQAGSPPVAVYNPEDVARIASERRPAPAPFVLPAVPDRGRGNGRANGTGAVSIETEALAQLPAGDDPIRQLFAAALRAVLSPPSPPVAEKVAETRWVDMSEAAAILGLTEPCARRLIKARGLETIRDAEGVHVRRKDLEQL